MASLILHGDLGDGAEPLERTLQVVPILGAPQNLAAECTPLGKLPIGMVYRAVVAMVEGLNGSAAEAESIVVINHSICDTEGPFSQRASYWADRQSVVKGKSVSVRLIRGGGRPIKTKS